MVNDLSLLIKLKARRTRYDLLKLRAQLEIAEKALGLLEEKYRLLLHEVGEVRKTLLPFQQELADKVAKAYALLSEAVVSLGFRKVYRAALSTKANDEVEMKWTTIRGVAVPRLESKIKKRDPLQRGYSLTSTDHLVDKAAEAFEDMLAYMIHVAELENILRMWKREMEHTRVRVSALQKVLIPSLQHEIRMIENSIEEHDRHRHVQVKWVKEMDKGSLVF